VKVGYVPNDWLTIAWAGALLAGVLLAGLLVTRLPPRWYARALAWVLTVGGTAGVERLCAGEPAGVRMLALIGALLFGMKTIVGVESVIGGEPRLTAWQWLLFAALWPGMRPAIFRGLGGGVLRDSGSILLKGIVHLLIGAALIALAACVWHLGRPRLSDTVATVLATLLLLPGISLVAHFGVFNLAAGLWRRVGVDARPLFRTPLAARSLGEFWGRRWNLAFSEMTAIGVYRPLSGALGKTAGMAGAFACSGLLHEVAISLPVLWGFGLPSLYFVLHGALVLTERALERRGVGVATWGWASRVWVLGWLALPAAMLFHVPFLRGCVWPLIGMGE
jgi:alginate O-acetyltransferase complex protein AlgI